MYSIRYTKQAAKDVAYWKQNNPKVYERLKELIAEILALPAHGKGRPKMLSGPLRGLLSRRLTKADRIVYGLDREMITIYQARYHYDDK